MKNSEFKRIKQKIQQVDPIRWWGDDYDVRFYLVSKIKKINHQMILDIGGGIGIISSEINSNNTRINVDFSFSDLVTCKNKVDSNIETVCASMTNLPFINGIFDSIICANILEVGKSQDIKLNNIKQNNLLVKVHNFIKLIHNYSNIILRQIPYLNIFLSKKDKMFYETWSKINPIQIKNILVNYLDYNVR